VILTYENWKRDVLKNNKTAIMPDAMTTLEVWDGGDTSIPRGIYLVEDVYPGHNEVVLAQGRIYMGIDGWYTGPMVFAYKDVMNLIGLGLADYS
jgi:hypothetical protein